MKKMGLPKYNRSKDTIYNKIHLVGQYVRFFLFKVSKKSNIINLEKPPRVNAHFQAWLTVKQDLFWILTIRKMSSLKIQVQSFQFFSFGNLLSNVF